MSKYIKVFDTVEEYDAYSGGTSFVSPNISYVRNADETKYDENEIKHYTEKIIPGNLVDWAFNADGVPISIVYSAATVSDYCYNGVSVLKDVVLRDNVISIGKYAFRNCSALSSITIPNSVISIGMQAFYQCIALSSITIPSGVTSIGMNCFAYSTGLTSVTCLATNPPALASGAFINVNCPIYVPAASVELYKNATNWNSYSSRIQAIP